MILSTISAVLICVRWLIVSDVVNLMCVRCVRLTIHWIMELVLIVVGLIFVLFVSIMLARLV